MGRFIALPVGQGDAFYLETANGSVLVDGGRARKSFPSLFKRKVGKKEVDIVVATHNDADHVGGILGILEDKDFRIGELWLPARWLQTLPFVLRRREEVVCFLVIGFQKLERTKLGRLLFNNNNTQEIINDWLREMVKEKETTAKRRIELDGLGWPQDLWEQTPLDVKTLMLLLECNQIVIDEHVMVTRNGILPFKRGAKKILWAIAAAERIAEIARKGYERGIKVRWFLYDQVASNNFNSITNQGDDWIIVANAREVASLARVEMDFEALFALLRLTVANAESMVLFTSENPRVLFTSDSDLSNVNLPEMEGAVVTVPHHGSEINKRAYDVVTQKVSSPIWVRSDGRYKKRPCQEYIRAPGSRFCTRCRNKSSWKEQTVFLKVDHYGKWFPKSDVLPCSCQ